MAPFDDSQFDWLTTAYTWRGSPDVDSVLRLVKDSDPDAVLVSSWHIGAYRRVLREIRSAGVTRVLCMDNQWLATPKQWLGRLTWRQHIRPYYDLAFVPGDRQVYFARRLGFRRDHILRGLYCADTAAFARPAGLPTRDRAFLFVGRLVREKGIDVLADAYRIYRRRATRPWPLRIVGTGPELHTFAGIEGVELLGFVQPRELPATMWQASALVCPSIFEPWGVVVHEAAASGLCIICSESAGAAVHMVQDGYNGYLVPAGDVSDLAMSLLRVSGAPDHELAEMSAGSVLLSRQLTPDRWARYLIAMLAAHGNGHVAQT